MTQAPDRTSRSLSCPSGSADDRHARVFGIVGGTAEEPQVTYLERPLPVTPELLAQLEGVSPAEVFRVVSPCAEHRCKHFAQGECGVAKHVTTLPAATSELPTCGIRTTCRWFAEHGTTACVRCPQVVTLMPESSTPSAARRRLPIV